MYALSSRTHRQEDSDEDDHPQAPVRNNIIGDTEARPSSIRSGSGGVSAAIMSARARRSAQPRNSYELEDEVEDSYEVNEAAQPGPYKGRILRSGAVGAVAIAGMSPSSTGSRYSSTANEDSFIPSSTTSRYTSPARHENACQDSRNPRQARQNMAQTFGQGQPTQDQPIEARCVSDDSADIEAQVHSRMQNEARDIAEMVHEQLMQNAAVPVDVQPGFQDTSSVTKEDQDESTTETQRKRRVWLIGIGLLAIIAVVAVAVGVAVSKKNGGKCSFCFDGSTPSNLETNDVFFQSCAEYREQQIQLDSSDPDCIYGQAMAWSLCECPTLPPPPENPSCTYCKGGAIPLGEGCEENNTFVALMAEGSQTSCDDLLASTFEEGCTCPPDDGDGHPTPMESVLQPLSGEKLNDPSTPQYEAFNWIANEDAANLSPTDTPEETIKNRYVAALLYYAFGGNNWKEQYNFLSEDNICTWNKVGLDNLVYGIVCDSADNVEVLRLSVNNLEGPLPEEIGYFSGLKNVDMANNTVVGPLPNSLESLTRLEYLNFTNNVLTGTLPEFLFTHQHLTYIQLDDNHFKGTLSPSLGTSPNLALLWVGGSELTGTIPPSVGQSSVLANLGFQENQLTGTIPEFVSTSPIWYLWIASNRLVGSMPTSIGHLSSLSRFALYDNSITGTIPSELGLCQNLRYLYLGENPQLVGTIPTELGQLRSLEDLWIDQANIDGPIPTELGRLARLERLFLYTNRLTGTIPTELGQCLRLDRLVLSANSLTGDIGTVIDSLPRGLEALDVQINLLQGTIPASIGALTDIFFMGARRNALSGSIPSEFGALTKLEFLYLSENQFSGSVPSELASLPLLVKLRLEDNALTGGMDAFCGNNFELFSANTCSDPDDVECACCTHCCVPGTTRCEEL